MESHPQNPEFRINPENFHPCSYDEVCFKGIALNFFMKNEEPTFQFLRHISCRSAP